MFAAGSAIAVPVVAVADASKSSGGNTSARDPAGIAGDRPGSARLGLKAQADTLSPYFSTIVSSLRTIPLGRLVPAS